MSTLRSRQAFTNDPEFIYDDERSFWWTRTGQIVRWSIFFGLFFLFLAYMIIGYWHAKRRINKGLAPLGYHRWLLNRQQRARYDPRFQNPQVFYRPYAPQQGTEYGMNTMPPPVYDSNAPPTYQPPEGATKVDPSQWRSQPTRRPQETGEASPEYEAPSGPPAAALRADHTGASTVSNNPYRV